MIFIIDIFINFFSVYKDDKEGYITNRWKIAKNYLKFWFWIDLVSCIDFEAISNLLLNYSDISQQQNNLDSSIFKWLKMTKI